MSNLKIISLSKSRVDAHIHTDSSGDYISGANFKKHGEDKGFIKLNNYQAAMVELYAKNLHLRIKNR